MRDSSPVSRILVHLAVAVVTLSAGACTPFDDVMVALFGRSMRSQASLDPYENPRPAPEGSVPFAASNFPAGPDQLNLGQAERAPMPPPMRPADLLQQNPVVMELENPVEATEASLARGEELYVRYCAVCHGDRGIGAEAYIADRHPVLSAYDLAGQTVQEYPDGFLYGMIRVGRGLMPPYGHAISHFDRWKVVNYVRQLQDEHNQRQAAADGEAGQSGSE